MEIYFNTPSYRARPWHAPQLSVWSFGSSLGLRAMLLHEMGRYAAYIKTIWRKPKDLGSGCIICDKMPCSFWHKGLSLIFMNRLELPRDVLFLVKDTVDLFGSVDLTKHIFSMARVMQGLGKLFGIEAF